MSETMEQMLAANQQRADETLQKEISRILAGGPNAASEADVAFLTARRSYLTDEQKVTFGIVEDEAPKKKGKKTDEE